MSATAQPQPQPGDVMLGCVHRPNPYSAHVYQVPKGMPFKRPDGTSATATWIVLCAGCHGRYVVAGSGNASDAPIACDLTWEADDPPIQYKDPS